jgi:hypothetical protein
MDRFEHIRPQAVRRACWISLACEREKATWKAKENLVSFDGLLFAVSGVKVSILSLYFLTRPVGAIGLSP